jgi:hypothetical protein
MSRSLARLAIISACLFGSWQVQAQQSIPLQKEYYIGEGDVELHTGSFAYSSRDISIGAQDASLSLTRYFGVHQQTGSFAPFGANTGHSYEIALYRRTYLEGGDVAPNWSYEWNVVIGRTVERIRYSNTPRWIGPVSEAQARTTLITSDGFTGPFVYTREDGTRIEFPAMAAGSCPDVGFGTVKCAQASAIISPNGERQSLTYETVGSRLRLRTVISNRGYAIGIDYNSSAAAGIERVCAVNLAVQYMAPAGPCPTGARAVTYSYSPESIASLLTEVAQVVRTDFEVR